MRHKFTLRVLRLAGSATLIGVALAGTALASTVTVYQDNFSGGPDHSLVGRGPQIDHGVSPTWAKNFSSGYNSTGLGRPAGGKGFHPFWRANGTITGSFDSGGNGALEVAGLNFKPVPGRIYTLSAKVLPTGYIPCNNSRDGLVSVGFISSSQASNTKPFYQGEGPWMFSEFTGSQNSPSNTVVYYFGPNLSNGFQVKPNPAALGNNSKIVLNTTQAQWTATDYYNGTQVGQWRYGSTGSPNPTGITQVAIGVNGHCAKVISFRLTEMTAPLLAKVARPYPTFQPKMPPPARHLYVANIGKLPPDQRRLLVTLQGIVNRAQPRIYLVWGPNDLFWLKQMEKQGQTGKPIPVKNPLSLVKIFRGSIHGAVIPDPKVFDSPDIAVDVATVDDLVVATPQLARQLHLPIKVDLRGKFKNDVAALRYLRTELVPRMNPYLFLCLDPAILGDGAADQIIAARGITFWATGPWAKKDPGANWAGEKRQVARLFAATPLDGVVRGFPWYGTGMGLGEGGGVTLASQYGKVTVASDYVHNFSVFSGVPLKSLRQKFAPPPKLDRSKAYISLTISDGDNLNTWQKYFWHWFKSPYHGKFAVGWGMGPTLIDVAPTIAQWYYRHAGPKDEFLADVSGIGYMYPSVWADRLRDRQVAFESFYRWTWRYMRKMDMKTLRVHQDFFANMATQVQTIVKVATLLPQVKFLMPDYGYAGEKGYHRITYQLPSGQVIFRAGTNFIVPKGFPGKIPKEREIPYLLRQIRAHLGKKRPRFMNVFIWNWGMGPHRLYRMLKMLGPDYVDVTPSQLNMLYREAHRIR